MKTQSTFALVLIWSTFGLHAGSLLVFGTATLTSSGSNFGFPTSTTADWSITFDDSPTAFGASGFQDYFVPANFTFSTNSVDWTATAFQGSQPTISLIDRNPGRDLVNFAFGATTNSAIDIAPFDGSSAFFTIRFQGDSVISGRDLSSIRTLDFPMADTAFIAMSDRGGNSASFAITSFETASIPEPNITILLIFASSFMAVLAVAKYRLTRRCSQPLATSFSGFADDPIAVDHNQ